MSKKQDFPNLGRGTSRVQSSISSFKKKGSDNIVNNPLVDKPKVKKPVKQNAKKKEKEVETSNETKPIFKVEKPKTPKTVHVSEIPDDFKSHSALFSKTQLDDLRNLVNFKKWKEDSKFTIQQAIYEAIEELFANRIPCDEFPDDFEPYAPAFSEKQWQKLDEEFVPEIRFIQKGKYGLKYAIYEAIALYLKKNPINI